MDLNNKIDDLINKLNKKNFFEVIKEGNILIDKFPNLFIFYNIVGLAHQNIKNFEESEKFFLKAIEMDPKEVSPKNNLANTYLSLGKLNESEKLFKEILAQHGEKAKIICTNILEKNPNNIAAHIILSKQTNYNNDDNNLKEMIDNESKLNERDINKNKICFAIGKAYEDKKDIDNSFNYIKKGNILQDNLINYKIEKDELIYKNIKDIFSRVKLNLQKRKYNKKKTIFICGLPRSGTTLVEQILSSHSKVNGAGELTYLKKSIDSIFFKENKLNEIALNNEIKSDENILNDMYYNFLEIHKFENSIITDKAPQNFMWIGFIKLFFPNSKVIHCFRNANDNFLSLYKNNFASNQHMGWSFNGSNITKFYNLYSDLMKFWKLNCEGFFYEINYDKLVIDNESEIKKLLSYCELEQEENCFNHYKNKTPITTVSLFQARKPIYKSSLNSSQNYSKYLDKYFKQLDKYN